MAGRLAPPWSYAESGFGRNWIVGVLELLSHWRRPVPWTSAPWPHPVLAPDPCGLDPIHRQLWIFLRLQALALVFAIDILDFAILDNEIHVVLRNRPDRVRKMSPEEVVRRWLRLSRWKLELKGEPTAKQIEEELAKCVAAHTHAQFERHESTHRHELELRAVMVVEQACHRTLVALAAHAVDTAPDQGTARALEAAAARFGRAGAEVSGTKWIGASAERSGDALASAWLDEIAQSARLLDRLTPILAELDAQPAGETARLGLA